MCDLVPSLEDRAGDGQPRYWPTRLDRFEVVLVWALDRVSREGVEAMLAILCRLAGQGAAVWSLMEPWAETADPGMAKLLASLCAWMAGESPLSFGADQGRAGAPVSGRACPAAGTPDG
jgi:Resolvase, N terminal domain